MRNGPSFRGQHQAPFSSLHTSNCGEPDENCRRRRRNTNCSYNCSCRRQSSGVVDAIDDIFIYSRSIGIQYLQTCLRQKHTAIAVLALIRDRLIEIDPGTAKLRHTTLDRNKNRLEANHTCSRR